MNGLPPSPFNLPPGCSLADIEGRDFEDDTVPALPPVPKCEDCGCDLDDVEEEAGICIRCANQDGTPRGVEARAVIGANTSFRSRERRLFMAGWYIDSKGTMHPPRRQTFND